MQSQSSVLPVIYHMPYTDHVGPEISVNLCIASSFSQHIAIGSAGPTTALESMGAEQTFRCRFLNIDPSYKQ